MIPILRYVIYKAIREAETEKKNLLTQEQQITTPLSHDYPWHTQIHRDAYGYGLVPPEIDQRLVVDLRFFGYVKPVYDNHVHFSSTATDCFGMPQVR